MKRLLWGSFAAGVAMFVWGWVFWGVIGMVFSPFKPIPGGGEKAILAAVTAAFSESAVYRFPFPAAGDQGGSEEASASNWMDQQREGPIFEIVYHADGDPPMNPKMFALGFFHMWFTAFVVALIMNQFSASARLSTYRDRLVFVIILGLVSALWTDTGRYIWFYHPCSHELFHAVYHISGMIVAGLVLAAIVKRRDLPGTR